MSHLVHAILDEASSLGQLQIIDDMLAMGRGYSVRLQFYYQSLGQLKKCFPEGQDQTLLGNTTQVFFGINDPQTADFVSARLGEETIVVDSGGTNRGQSWQTGHGGTSSGSSSGSNANWQQIGRKLLKPEEVTALPQRTAITFAPGVRPICTTLLRYYEEGKNLRPRGWFDDLRMAWRTLVKSAVILAIAVIAAIVAQPLPKKGEVQHVEPSGQIVRNGQGEHQQRSGGNRRGTERNGGARRP